MNKRRFLHTALALASGLALQAQAAEAWPSKPLRIIVGYPSGSSPDIQARMLAEPLSKALGQAVVVENKPGASGNIGADALAKADDGHTIGVIGNGPLTSSPFLYAKLPYQPQKDFAPIALIGSAPLVWVVPKAEYPGNTAAYLKAVHADGDRLAYGSIGPGSGGHLGMELVKQALGFKALHVPFNGGPPILNAMMGGQVQLTLLPAATVMPLVQAGKLAAVAVTSAQRSPLAPELPSMDELGAKGVNIEVWNAVMAPARMPAAHQARLASELAKILGNREIRQKLLLQGWKDQDPSPAALTQRIQADTAVYRNLIAQKGIKIDG
ncbi:Tripartite-type tricarboxylate transporter, receptor component TctC [Rhodoferax sp. OV413]|uniref:Bug family tripartite tricarboxylate transporter substrate binding protein n=1 Tax=Rhodoferax sp. OV413 TaxID=1855285 RepID=UPI00087E0775|nr:tripartite tricarboxylate transporter substrate-binding protein [Rhodoferax sp. OV413]SDP56073.1 Tripartite-type tricarboxylate transporter, receptor component TctC [Rhodoferax sp. OV413]